MNIYLPEDLLEAVKQYILVVRLSEDQEIGLSEALITHIPLVNCQKNN
jgi:hypothetical protein